MVIVAGCNGAPPTSEAPQPAPTETPARAGIATLPASDATHATLHIAKWATYQDDTTRFVLALDDREQELARLTVGARDKDQAELTGISPDRGTVIVTRSGAVSGAADARLQQLARALADDAVANGAFQREGGAAPAVHPDTVTVGFWGTFGLGWNLFNTGGRQPEGNLCPNAPRESVSAWIYNGSGSCWFGGWVDPGNPFDCRAWINWSENGTQTGDCMWEVLQNNCSHPICQSGGALSNSCDSCASKICAQDPYCCNTEWDSICVSEVSSICKQNGC